MLRAVAFFVWGVSVSAIVERLSQQNGSFIRWRNIAIKAATACLVTPPVLGAYPWFVFRLLLSRIFGSDWDTCPSEDGKVMLSSLINFFFFLAGVVTGTTLQPVGLTGGIATGKSTVSEIIATRPSSKQYDQKASEKTTSTARGATEGEDIDDDTEFVVIDVDGIAHDILLPTKLGNDSVYYRLIAEFGSGILEERGNLEAKDSAHMGEPPPLPQIDRLKLGAIVFRDVRKRRKLNSITHPKIIKIMLKRILFEGLNLGCILHTDSWLMTRLIQFIRPRHRVVCVDIPLLFEGGLPVRMLFGTIIVVSCSPILQLERLSKRNPDLSLEQCRQRIKSQIPVEEKADKAHIVIHNNGSLTDLTGQVHLARNKIANRLTGTERGIELSLLVVAVGGLIILNRSIW